MFINNCPKCGIQPEIRIGISYDPFLYSAQCPNCFNQFGAERTKEDAAETWNQETYNWKAATLAIHQGEPVSITYKNPNKKAYKPGLNWFDIPKIEPMEVVSVTGFIAHETDDAIVLAKDIHVRSHMSFECDEVVVIPKILIVKG